MKQVYRVVIAVLKKYFHLVSDSACTRDCRQGRDCTCTTDAKINQNVIWMKNDK